MDEAFLEIQRVFVATFPEKIDALTTARTDTKRVRMLAHRLRGTGASYGFRELSVAAQQVEDASPAELDGALDALLATLARLHDGHPPSP